jgi:hypothetical protein
VKVVLGHLAATGYDPANRLTRVTDPDRHICHAHRRGREADAAKRCRSRHRCLTKMSSGVQ